MTLFNNEKNILRFLFGEMTEKERVAFEDKFISDEELFGSIKAVEDELIEKYIRGWMNSAEQVKFEKNFLNTKKRRENVKFSRLMLDKLNEYRKENAFVENAETSASEKSFWQNLSNLFSAPKIAAATAFSLLIIAFGGWFLYQNFGNGNTEIVKHRNSNLFDNVEMIVTPTVEISINGLSQNSAANAANSDSGLIEDKTENSPKEAENSNNIQKTPTPAKSNGADEKTPEPTKPPVRRTSPNPLLALFAGTVRSEGKNYALDLPENAEGAILQLNLETVDHKNYIAKLTDADGKIIYQKGDLKVRQSKISFFVPAQNLRKGDYMLKLYGKNDSGNYESSADFQFRVN